MKELKIKIGEEVNPIGKEPSEFDKYGDTITAFENTYGDPRPVYLTICYDKNFINIYRPSDFFSEPSSWDAFEEHICAARTKAFRNPSVGDYELDYYDYQLDSLGGFDTSYVKFTNNNDAYYLFITKVLVFLEKYLKSKAKNKFTKKEKYCEFILESDKFSDDDFLFSKYGMKEELELGTYTWYDFLVQKKNVTAPILLECDVNFEINKTDFIISKRLDYDWGNLRDVETFIDSQFIKIEKKYIEKFYKMILKIKNSIKLSKPYDPYND